MDVDDAEDAKAVKGSPFVVFLFVGHLGVDFAEVALFDDKTNFLRWGLNIATRVISHG